MTQCCGKIPSRDDVKQIRESVIRGNALQGKIGEQIAAEVAASRLNLIPEFFDPPQNGFDSVYRDKSGKLVIVEAKFTEKSGYASLSMTNHGRQGSVEWIEHNARKMCDPTNSQHTQDNAHIGAEILRVGAENVSVILIHTNPQTLQTEVQKIR